MARFGESFIQGLMNPTYQQGLFTAAQGAGSFSRRQREAEQFKQLTSGAPVGSSVVSRVNQLQQLSIEAARRGDTSNARAYEAAANQLQTTLKTQGQQSISAIQQQLIKETDPTKMQELEDAMVSVARQTQQTDPSAFIGAANQVADQRTKRENDQLRQNNLIFSQREAAIAQAYFGVSNEDKEQFVENVKQSGFGEIITQLEGDRLKHEDYLEKREKAKADARASLNIPSIEERINNLPDNLQQDFKVRLEEIEKSQPDFDNGGTWMGNERERAWRKLDSLSRDIGAAKGDVLSRANTRSRTIQVELKSINNDLESPASVQASKLFIPIAKDQINAEENPTMSQFTSFGEIKANDPRVQKRAIELATQDKVTKLQKRKALLEQELTEVKEVFEPSTKSKEDSDTDPLGIR
jgi:hypothetical protein